MLLVSTELDEVLALSDRIAVMFDGHVVAVLDRDSTDATELGLYMAGSSPDAEPTVARTSEEVAS